MGLSLFVCLIILVKGGKSSYVPNRRIMQRYTILTIYNVCS